MITTTLADIHLQDSEFADDKDESTDKVVPGVAQNVVELGKVNVHDKVCEELVTLETFFIDQLSKKHGLINCLCLCSASSFYSYWGSNNATLGEVS